MSYVVYLARQPRNRCPFAAYRFRGERAQIFTGAPPTKHGRSDWQDFVRDAIVTDGSANALRRAILNQQVDRAERGLKVRAYVEHSAILADYRERCLDLVQLVSWHSEGVYQLQQIYCTYEGEAFRTVEVRAQGYRQCGYAKRAFAKASRGTETRTRVRGGFSVAWQHLQKRLPELDMLAQGKTYLLDDQDFAERMAQKRRRNDG